MGIDALLTNPLPERAERMRGAFSGPLILCAGGWTVWGDYRKAVLGFPDSDVMCVNDIGMHLRGNVVHWYSNHVKHLTPWNEVRKLHFPPAKYLHSNHEGHVFWPLPASGTSSLSAVYVGLIMGYNPILLCGVPLDNGPHYFEPKDRTTNFEIQGKDTVWLKARDRVFDGRVKSYSGRTREWLGG